MTEDLSQGKERESAWRSLTWYANGYQGICETLRFIYDDVYELKDKELKKKLTEHLIDAMIMVKKMNLRLVYYRKTYKDTSGHSGKNLIRLWGSVKRKMMRRNREEVYDQR